MIQQVSDLGWIDFDLDVPVMMPNSFANFEVISPTHVQDLLNHPVDWVVHRGCKKLSFLRARAFELFQPSEPEPSRAHEPYLRVKYIKFKHEMCKVGLKENSPIKENTMKGLTLCTS